MELNREITLPASPEEVWDSLAEPAWLGDDASIELCPAGEVRAGERTGFVEEVAEPRRLVFWWSRPEEDATLVAGLAQGPGYVYECRIRVGGEERLLHVDARVARDADSRALRVDGIIQHVTDWQRSEAARAQSEAVQTAVIDAALDTVIVINAHGLVVEWNKAAQSTFGWTRAEAVGQELATLIIPSAYRAAHRRAVAAHGTAESKVLGRRLELTALRRDGTEFPVELTIVPVLGERLLFAGYLRDITERKRADEARRATEGRWRALVEQIPAVTYLGRFDETASMIYISPQIELLEKPFDSNRLLAGVRAALA